MTTFIRFLSSAVRQPCVDLDLFSDGDLFFSLFVWGETARDREAIRAIMAGDPVPESTRIRARIRRSYFFHHGSRLDEVIAHRGVFSPGGLALVMHEMAVVSESGVAEKLPLPFEQRVGGPAFGQGFSVSITRGDGISRVAYRFG